jgi:NAD(P)-dependent dehydrogenase (short-subunit alcohol dehydrogenase family)
MAKRELAGKTALVTGATSGIGFATAQGLAQLHAHVLLHGRSQASATAAAEALKIQIPTAEVTPVHGDLASLEAIKRLAVEVARQAPVLDILINNAGLLTTARKESVDGIELQLAVNHIAPFMLTQKLFDPLTAGRAPGRVINVSSKLHFNGKPDFADLHWSRRRYKGWQAYADSKFMLSALTHAWARRVPVEKASFNSLHPGLVGSNFGKKDTWFAFLMPVIRPFMLSSEDGAKTSLHLASAPDVAALSGYYFDHGNARAAHPAALDPALQEELWDKTARLCGLSG